MLDQLIVGLNSFDVMDAMKENQSGMEPIFVENYAARFLPNANTLLDEIIADFSESNLKITPVFKLSDLPEKYSYFKCQFYVTKTAKNSKRKQDILNRI